jgi:RNA polymerase sigma factor (sigma-70 family)
LTRKEYNSAVDLYSGRLYGYVLKCLKREEDAQDIVQDVFERLWNHRNHVEVEKAKAWLFTTAHNALINFAKKRARMDLLGERVPENGQRHEHRFEMKEIVDMVVDTLPPLQKSILLLRDLEGYHYDEIGQMLSISESQVKVYLFRARRKIKEQLKDISVIYDISQ